MLFHTIKTITITQFGLLKEYPEDILRVKVWMPKRILLHYTNRLIADYNKLVKPSDDKPNVELENRYSVASMEIRINLFVVLHDVLRNHWITPAPPEILAMYKKYFKKDFEFEDIHVIVEKIAALKKRLEAKLEEMQNIHSTEPKGFNQFIMGMETILGYSIGDQKLYLIPHYIEQVEYNIKNKKPNNTI